MASVLLIGGLGYIGSRLYPYLKALGHEVDNTWDLGFYSPYKLQQFDYKNLPPSFLSNYDVVILLAGHSSIAMCEADPTGSFHNNVINFYSLLEKIRPDQDFFYASSGANLSGAKGSGEDSPLQEAMCHYDMHKQTIERIARLSGKKTYGLRFGTVAGLSRNPRLESLVNSMYVDALDQGQVRLSNGSKYRSVLGLPDLCKAVGRMLEKKGPPGVYNMASVVLPMSEVAARIVSLTGAELVTLPPTDLCYDFRICSNKFEETYDFQFEDTIESIVEDLKGLPLSLRDKTTLNRSTNVVQYKRN